jgi:hypothetical protein
VPPPDNARARVDLSLQIAADRTDIRTMRQLLIATTLWLTASMPAGATPREPVFSARLDSPRVEPLKNYHRGPLPLLRRDSRSLRRIENFPHCSYTGRGRVCR